MRERKRKSNFCNFHHPQSPLRFGPLWASSLSLSLLSLLFSFCVYYGIFVLFLFCMCQWLLLSSIVPRGWLPQYTMKNSSSVWFSLTQSFFSSLAFSFFFLVWRDTFFIFSFDAYCSLIDYCILYFTAFILNFNKFTSNKTENIYIIQKWVIVNS